MLLKDLVSWDETDTTLKAVFQSLGGNTKHLQDTGYVINFSIFFKKLKLLTVKLSANHNRKKI